jgi:hypothetical protein
MKTLVQLLNDAVVEADIRDTKEKSMYPLLFLI